MTRINPRSGAARPVRRHEDINPIAAWHDEHVYFNHLLQLVRRELDVFHHGGRPNYELMYDIISYLRGYGEAVKNAGAVPRDALFGTQEQERYRELPRQIALEA